MKTPKGVLFLFFACLCACGASARAEVGFSFSLPNQASAHRLTHKPKLGITTIGEQAILEISAAQRQEQFVFDSLYTRASVELRVKETNLVQPLPMDYATYRALRMKWDIRKAFADEAKLGFKQGAAERASEGIAIDVPFKIKSKTFRRIFGGDNIGLRVQGNITIDGKLRQQKFDEIQTANQSNSNTNFNIDMTQRFTIAGKIGEKVQVDVNQDSERLFDFENSLKLTYTGDKDEIIQKIEAGNVNLSLGTKLATFSGQNKGLFGIKTEAKIGAMKLTGIASLERGQKNRQEPNKDSRRATWTENDFLQNVYFWLTDRDTTFNFDPNWSDNQDITLDISGYRENYRHVYDREHVAAPITIVDIEVWESTIESGSQQGVTTSYGVAVSLDSIELLNTPEAITTDRPNSRSGLFKQLVAETDYTIEPRFGYIRLKRPLQGDKYLACSFSTSNNDTFGRIGAPSDSVRLILLRSNNPNPTDLTWNLMFRHVYSVQSTNVNPEKFEVTIERESAGGSVPEEGPSEDETYLEFFRFDREGPNGASGADGYVDNRGGVMDWTNGEMHFLDLTPFYPSGFYEDLTGEFVVYPLRQIDSTNRANQDSTVVLDSTLYTRPPSQIASGGTAWKFQTKTQGSTSQYDLGPLVLEGSEEITFNGTKLTRGSDYTIDYLSGQLKILNDGAKAPGANLVITYESGQVFQLDRKTLLGARAEYELWENSYVGGMVLKLDEKSLDRRVRIGNEPISNTLYDLNSQLKFKPNFLTAIADRLPLVKTNVGSEFSIDGEVARVIPNPNSLSNDATGDANGVAFLDDFEASRRSTPLGLLRRNWTISSIPSDPDIDSLRGRFRWWNPVGDYQVYVKDVFPDRETNSQVADRLQSLVLEFTPDTTTGAPDESWGGVMRYLGSGYEDQSRSQYLEFWIQLPGDPQGRLVVDFGSISEDALPNDSMDSEDTPTTGEAVNSAQREYGDGVLVPEEDTGIDGLDRADPEDVAFWNGLTRPAVPSWDDWSYSVGSDVYDQVNGTENNLNDEGGNFPDSEDLNGNQNLDKTNDYFSYDIELSFDSPYIVGGQGNDKNWRLFRIPLDDEEIRREVGAPSLTNVRWARMYLTGMTRKAKIQIVQNDIVSNEWLPEYVDVDSTEFIAPAVINNHENPGYNSPPGVQGEIDPITNLRQREQSLALKIESLGDGTGSPREFFITKNLYQQINLIEYKRLKMFVHGGGIDEALFEDGQYQLILRLGSSYTNTRTNYYEIVKTIYKGWDARNHIDVGMNDLSILRKLREEAGRASGDTTTQDNLRRFAVLMDSLNASLGADSLVINGTPSLQNIGFIALGVRALKHYNNEGDEIWVDELRVSDIYKDAGVAGEIAASLKIADLLTLSGSYNQQDADFHNVNERTGRQNSSQTLLNSLNLNVAKFGLDQYGFALPLAVTRSELESTPKYIPNTDVRVDQDNPDTTLVRHEERMNYTASYSKTGNSPNPLVRWTLEKLRVSWDHSTVKNKDYQFLKQEQSTTGARADYTFPTARGRGIAPIWFMNQLPLLSQLGNPHIFFKPKQVSGNFSAQRTNSFSLTRLGRRTESPNFTASGSGSIAFDITETIGTGLSQSFGWTQVRVDSFDRDNNGQFDSTAAFSKSWKDLMNLSRSDLNQEGWNWTNAYSPQFGRWLSPNFNYNSTYTWNNGNRTNSENQAIQNSRTIGGDLTLDFKQVFGSGDSGRRPNRPLEPARPKGGLDSTQTDSMTTEEAVPRGPGFSPLKVLGKAFIPLKTALLLIDPVQMSYDNSLRHSQNGLKGQADLPYRLGFTTAANATESTLLTSVQTLSETRDYTARSGLRVSRDIRTTASWSLRESDNQANLNTGSTEQTYFWLPNALGAEAAFPFADLVVDWSGLERVGFMSKATRAVSLTSGLSSKIKDDWQNNSNNIITSTYNRQWSPLIGVNVTWLNDMDTQVRINAANSLTKNVNQGTTQRTSSRGANATVSYTLRTGFRLPILWFGAMRMQNQTTLSLNVDYQTNKQERSNSGESYSIQREDVQWSVQPRLNYSFSNTVSGGAQLQYQQTKDKVTNRGSRLFEFGINVQIAIRG